MEVEDRDGHFYVRVLADREVGLNGLLVLVELVVAFADWIEGILL